ncbi:adenine phosphoribosyltransferase [Candidatus Fermentibacteria bacterium]|nr:MAG: adenine phosphoribosyltransferase [Candidatus Fermentibacteria bacterium]
MLTIDEIAALYRDVVDFPRKGIVFKDLTTVLTHPGALGDAVTHMLGMVENIPFNAVAAIESRGFMFGGIIADRMDIPLVLIRKPGKLPADVISEDYTLEYGTNTVEMHRNSLPEGSKVLIVDDLIATGGTAIAAGELIKRDGSVPVAAAFLMNLVFLGGAEKVEESGIPVHSLIKLN